MRPISRTPAVTALAVLLAAGLSACNDMDVPTSPLEGLEPQHAALPAAAEANRDLATLREVTASFHNMENGVAAGWELQVTGCLEHPTDGGMGSHFMNVAYFLDGEVNVEKPEVLLYAPRENGSLKLVAVEYLLPLSEWNTPDPPQLFGRDMVADQSLGAWLLHAWVWEHNPAGMFADWNPRITCDNAI